MTFLPKIYYEKQIIKTAKEIHNQIVSQAEQWKKNKWLGDDQKIADRIKTKAIDGDEIAVDFSKDTNEVKAGSLELRLDEYKSLDGSATFHGKPINDGGFVILKDDMVFFPKHATSDGIYRPNKSQLVETLNKFTAYADKTKWLDFDYEGMYNIVPKEAKAQKNGNCLTAVRKQGTSEKNISVQNIKKGRGLS
ncbi:MAG: hypothetical protein FWE47_01550 [Oscillospiraceae bacterium]|nr:hypothetical protein [Oscillospiraceae bacterium]